MVLNFKDFPVTPTAMMMAMQMNMPGPGSAMRVAESG